MASTILPDAGDRPARKLSVRTRFEILKRDEFRCYYCGRRSPDVVLEVDHIKPIAAGGTDDPLNLITSCWECNRGKSDVPLASALTSEDPHDKAIELLERERQLDEYNSLLARQMQRREFDAWDLVGYWLEEQGLLSPKQITGDDPMTFDRREFSWLKNALAWCPKEKIREFMGIAIAKDMTRNLRYVMACARNWRYEHTAAGDMAKREDE